MGFLYLPRFSTAFSLSRTCFEFVKIYIHFLIILFMNVGKKRMWVTGFTIAGSVIGAGILGLPYVFAQSGFLIGVLWIVLLGIILLFGKLCLGEVTLRTKEQHQFPGYAEKYLGKWGKRIIYFSMFFGIYAALTAYLIGEGQSLSKLFTGGIEYALLFGFGFWLIMVFLLHEGLRGLKKVETWGVFAIVSIVFILFFWLLPSFNLSNISYVEPANFFLPFGVTLFALMGFSCIPELRMEIKGSEKLLKKAIFIGALIPIIVYIIFSFSFVSVLGREVSEVATLSFGKIVYVLGIFTMLTSYFVLSFVLKDIFIYDLKKKKLKFWFVSFVPLVVYFAVSFFDVAGFVAVLAVAGIVSGGLNGSLALLINLKAKKLGDRKPEYSMSISWIVVIVIILIFALGIVTKLFF
jgi:amino acid permease